MTAPEPIRWIGRRTVSREEMPGDTRLRPVVIAAGAFGAAMPARDPAVSRQIASCGPAGNAGCIGVNPKSLSRGGAEAEARDDLLLIFPDPRDIASLPLDLGRPLVDGRAARLVA